MDECKKQGNEDLPIIFASTSKITFPGAGVAAMAGSKNTLANIRKRLSFQTIGPDKVNQLRHLRFLKDMNGVETIMNQHKGIIAAQIQHRFGDHAKQLAPVGVASWTPHGGYFISVDVMEGCAKRVVALLQRSRCHFDRCRRYFIHMEKIRKTPISVLLLLSHLFRNFRKL